MKIGDRVVAVKNSHNSGERGVIRNIMSSSSMPYLVEFDNHIKGGHNGNVSDVRVSMGHGWWHREEDLRLEGKMMSFMVGERVKLVSSGWGYSDKLIGGTATIISVDVGRGKDGFTYGIECHSTKEQISAVWSQGLMREDYQMNYEGRIDAITEWGKETNDLIGEIRGDTFMAINFNHRPGDCYITISYCSALGKDGGKTFSFDNACTKLLAFKNALLWWAGEIGKLEPELVGKTVRANIEGKVYDVTVLGVAK